MVLPSQDPTEHERMDLSAKSLLTASMNKEANIDRIPVKSDLCSRPCDTDSPVRKKRSFSLTDVEEHEHASGGNSNLLRTWSLQQKSDTTTDWGSGWSRHSKLQRQRAGRRFLFNQKRREFGLESVWRLSRKKFYFLSVLTVLKTALAVCFVCLIIIDFHNSSYRPADARHANFDVGTYPMSGMLLLASSSCLDAISIMIFVCGFLCQCGYFRYYMRFVFVDFLMAFTAVCALFISERSAISFLKEYFKIVLQYEYGESTDGEHGENNDGTDFVDNIQESAQCCGYAGASDWTKSKWWESRDHKSPYPWSCCTTGSSSGSVCFQAGCEQRIYSTAAYARIICQYLAIVKTVLLAICMLLCAAMYRDFVANTSTDNASRKHKSRRQNGEHSRDIRQCGDFSTSAGRVCDSPVAIATHLFTAGRQLFQIEEYPSENQPSLTVCEETDGGNGITGRR